MFLTNFEIIDLCKFYKIPLIGVYMKDELNFIKKNGNYVINLDSSHSNGTHWVALVINGKNNFYFDSFGCVPPTEVEMFINNPFTRTKIKYAYNNWICQDLMSTNCGFFCIGLFIYLQQHKQNKDLFKSSNDFINMFYDETKMNDSVLQLFFRNIKQNNIVSKKLLLL
jgi:hypothetical protein